jgi:hypothetical protein
MIPVFVTPDGVVLSFDKQQKPSEVEEQQEQPLHVIAAREAGKASTQKDTNKES